MVVCRTVQGFIFVHLVCIQKFTAQFNKNLGFHEEHEAKTMNWVKIRTNLNVSINALTETCQLL